MTILRALISRVSGLFGRRHRDVGLNDEIQAHLVLLAEENVRRGMTPVEARLVARREFGGIDQIKETYRDQRGLPFVDGLRQDMRYATRSLLRTPYFSIPVILSLAFAIGANVAVFSIINTLVLGTLPVRQPHELYQVTYAGDSGTFEGANYTWFEQVRDHARSVSAACLSISRLMKVTVSDRVEAVSGQKVNGTYYSTLGVAPLLGRLITPADEPATGTTRIAVISDAYWAARFARDPAVLGKTLMIDQIPHTIVGVTRPEFVGLQIGGRVDVTVPFDSVEYRQGWSSMALIVRVPTTASTAAATAELTTLLQGFAKSLPRGRGTRFQRVELEPAGRGPRGLGGVRERYSTPAVALMVIVSVMLLLACANWASLLMARASARRRDMAIRVSLGCSRVRLARQLLVESLMLSLAGGMLGFFAAWWSAARLPTYLAAGPRVDLHVAPDLSVLLFTFAVSSITGMLFGLAPAWLTRRIDVQQLRTSSATQDARSAGLGRSLVVLQVALSFVLVVAGSFFAATLGNLRDQNMGFAADGVLMFSLDAEGTEIGGPRLMSAHQQIVETLRAVPGVQRVTFATITPLSGNNDGKPISIPGFAPPPSDDQVTQVNTIGPDYFTTFGTRVLRGRGINAGDIDGAPRVAWVSERAARFYFPGVDPIGRPVEIGGRITTQAEIVGVVQDVMDRDPRTAPARMFYVPFFQRPADNDYTFAIRTSGNPNALVRQVQEVIQTIVPQIPLMEMTTLARRLDERLVNERLLATVSGVFGALALLLAAIGIYGIIAYTVARRTPELGLRVALGANAAHVLWLSLRSTVVVMTIGLAIGLAAAVGASDLLATMLFGLEPNDVGVYGTALGFLLATGVVASIPPVVRALRIQPMEALRYE